MIYVLRTMGAPFIKIGFSAGDIGARMLTLQTGCPFTIELIHVRAGEINDEKSLHRKLKSFRASGEWFHMTKETLAPFDLPFDSAPIDPESIKQILTKKQLKINLAFSFYRNPRVEWIIPLDQFCKKYECTFAEIMRIDREQAKFLALQISPREAWEIYRYDSGHEMSGEKMLFLVNKKAEETRKEMETFTPPEGWGILNPPR